MPETLLLSSLHTLAVFHSMDSALFILFNAPLDFCLQSALINDCVAFSHRYEPVTAVIP